jgi:hypothetical protein
VLSFPHTEELEMDFIERLFGMSPDGGSGSLEFLLLAIPIAGIAYVIIRRSSNRQRNSWTD